MLGAAPAEGGSGFPRRSQPRGFYLFPFAARPFLPRVSLIFLPVSAGACANRAEGCAKPQQGLTPGSDSRRWPGGMLRAPTLPRLPMLSPKSHKCAPNNIQTTANSLEAKP